MAHVPDKSSRRISWGNLLFLSVPALAFVLYIPLLSIGKLSDDFNLLNIRSLSDVFSEQGGWSFRFLGNLSILITNDLFQNSLQSLHLFSILVQCVNMILVGMILRNLGLGNILVLVGCGMYGFHFANVGSVAWLSDRWTLVASFFILSTFLLFVLYSNTRKRVFLFLSYALFVHALLTKETAVTIVPIIVSYSLIFDFRRVKQDLRKFLFVVVLPFTMISMLYLTIRFLFFPGGGYPIQITKALLGPVFYVSYSFIPFDYFDALSLQGVSANAIRIAFSESLLLRFVAVMSFLMLIAFFGWYLIHKRKMRPNRFETFGLLWFGFSIVPFIPWFDLRWLNPATCGVSLFGVGLLYRLFAGEEVKDAKARLSIACGLLILGSLYMSSSIRVQAWVGADRLAKEILVDSKRLYPTVRPHSFIIFINPPDYFNNAFVYRNGLENALQEVYSDTTLHVAHNASVGKRSRPLNETESIEFINQHKSQITQTSAMGGEVIILDFNDKTMKTERFSLHRRGGVNPSPSGESH
jgi:hypothetical protein